MANGKRISCARDLVEGNVFTGGPIITANICELDMYGSYALSMAISFIQI